jgi:hypothetical protein
MAQKEKKTTKKSRLPTTAIILFLGGEYDKQTLRMVYPTPQFIVLSKGTELYNRIDPVGIVDATYQLTNDWKEYEEYQAKLNKVV